MTVASIAVWSFLNRGIFAPADIVAKNTLAVSTVNGGDGAFIAQQAYNAGSESLVLVSSLAIGSLLVFIWAKPLSKVCAP